MKRKKTTKGITERLFSIVLAFVMALAVTPSMPLTVQAKMIEGYSEVKIDGIDMLRNDMYFIESTSTSLKCRVHGEIAKKDSEHEDTFRAVVVGPDGQYLNCKKAGHFGEKVTVSFDMHDHGTQIDDLVVPAGFILGVPVTESDDGWEFDGWYKDDNFNFKWTSSDRVESWDMTLHAKWMQKSDGGDAGGTSDTSGKVQVPTDKEKKNFGKGSLVSTPKELISAIDLTEGEKEAMFDNVNLNIWTEITKQEASSIKDADKQKITAKLPATYSVGTYLDIILKAQLDSPGRDERIITKTNKKVKIKIAVPTELQKAGRTYDIIRLHDGETTVLGVTREGYELTFETDGFSTYALIYSDAAPAQASAPAPTPAPASGGSPKTGDTSNMPLVMLILAMSVVGLGFTYRKKITE